ncbi:MAG: hypothetical protein JWM33_1374 [Caulobacteraceae bacterium]|nr:hypothetical protein [Caulobacteraceae bacterium]
MATRELFVTRLYEADLSAERGFAEFNADLLEACAMLQAEDRAGAAWAREHGYAGYTSYASLNDLPQRASAFGALKTRLDRQARLCAAELHLDLGGRRLKLESLWANILPANGFHSGHIHPGSVLSGTYYAAMPPGAAPLKLEDPRLAMMMGAPPREADAPESDRSFIYVQPVVGRVLMWESFLRHEVGRGRGRGDRVSISFNYVLA